MLGKKIKIITITLLMWFSAVAFADGDTKYNVTLCSNQTYLFGCRLLTPADGSGVYANTLDNGTTYLHLLFGAPKTTAYTAQIAPGQKYLFGCQVLTADGEVAVNQLQQNGCECDSTVTVTLKVHAPPQPVRDTVRYSYEAPMAQSSDKYLFGCRVLSLDGISTACDTLDAGDHDSIITVTLSLISPTPVVRDTVKVRYNADLKVNETYLLGCRQYRFNEAGQQQIADTLALPELDHDSIVFVNLNVLKVEEEDKTVQVAYTATIKEGQTYLFGCQQLTQANTYTNTLQRVAGGDSIVHLTLNVLQYTYGDTIASECDSLLWHNLWRKETKEYKDTLVGANRFGGDSIVTLHLTLRHSTTAAPRRTKLVTLSSSMVRSTP